MNRKQRKRELARRKASGLAVETTTSSSGSGTARGLIHRVFAKLEDEGFSYEVNDRGEVGLVECRFFPADGLSYRNAADKAEVIISITADDITHTVTVSANRVWSIGASPHRESVQQALSQIVAILPAVGFEGPDAEGNVSLLVRIPEKRLVEEASTVVCEAISEIIRFVYQSDPWVREAIASGNSTVNAEMFGHTDLSEADEGRRRAELTTRLMHEQAARIARVEKMLNAYRRRHSHGRRVSCDPFVLSSPRAIVFLMAEGTCVGNKPTMATNFERQALRRFGKNVATSGVQ